jgi:UDP-N-acetylglucosamine/UDP-N-acetyl-alpha-D-glucosaminouronate 4-epimerase
VKVLVTGGAGFIGSHLARALLQAGHRVLVLDNLSTGHRENLGAGSEAELIEADIRDRSALRAPVRGAEAVFHLAALPSVPRSWSDPVATLAANGMGTANVIEAAIEAGTGCFIYSSSSSVYGDQPGEERSEDLEPRPVSPYGYSKLLGEKIAHAHARVRDIRVVSLRYFNVFGPRQDPHSQYSAVIPRFIKAALEGDAITVHGDGRQSRDFTYVDNVVQANLEALCSTVPDAVLNVGCGRPIVLMDLVKAIGRLTQRSLEVRHVEPRPGDVRRSLANFSRATALLGYKPELDFETGLRKTYEWFAQQPRD